VSKQGQDQESPKAYSNGHLATLWSLVFEALACTEAEKAKKDEFLGNLISTLLSSSIELQEITYLVQTSFRISPNSQFILILLFQILNKSIGTHHEETVYTL
jgi:hypothetical protein